MKGIKTEWTEEMLLVLKTDFSISYNRELASRLGISVRTLIRKARELGIEKEGGFLEQRRSEITEMATKAHPPNKMKGVKGWCVVGGEKHRFQKGHIPAIKTNPDIVRKVTTKRNQTIRREKLRLKYGLRPATKLNLKNIY